MRRLTCSTIVALLALVVGSPAKAVTQFVTMLDAAQEVQDPPVVSDGSGFGSLSLVDLGGGNFQLDWSVTISPHFDFSNVAGDPALANGGAAVTGFHIHEAPRGANGGVVYGIYSPSHDASGSVMAVLNPDDTTTITGSWTPSDGNPAGNINTYAPTLLTAAPGEDVPLYFNVHTSAFGAGEIRGQIVGIPEPASGVLLLTAMAAGLLCRRRRRSG